MRDDIDHLDSYNAAFRDGTKPEADDFEPVENVEHILMGAKQPSCTFDALETLLADNQLFARFRNRLSQFLGNHLGIQNPKLKGDEEVSLVLGLLNSFKTILITSIYSAVRVQILKGQLRIYC